MAFEQQSKFEKKGHEESPPRLQRSDPGGVAGLKRLRHGSASLLANPKGVELLPP